MFIDASALCAVLLDEPDREIFYERIMGPAPLKLTSPVAVWETTRAIVRNALGEPEWAKARVEAFLDAAQVDRVTIGPVEQALAIEAFDRFGKLRHPAALNMGDCFAYACARSHEVPLLFKGDNFSRTDIESALTR